MTIDLNRTETAVLLDMLERLSDVMSNAGCNDYDIPATPQSKEFLIAAYKQQMNPDGDLGEDEWMPSLRAHNGRYECMDSILLGYLQSKIQTAAGQMTAKKR